MAIAKVLIPGKFDDAFLYMGRLFAAQADGSLVTLDLDSAIEDLADNSRIPFLTAAFSRNDQIGLAATRAGWPTDWLEAALDGMCWEIRPATKNIGQVETIFKGAHLDFTVYNRRIYVARTDGIFHADVDVQQRQVDFRRPEARSDARCHSLSIRFGALVASCGSDGLLVGYDEFQALEKTPRPKKLKHKRMQSIRASWMGYSLINYPASSESEVLRGSISKLGGFNTTVVTGFDEEGSPLQPIGESAGGFPSSSNRSELPPLTFLFNNGNGFFQQWSNGYVSVGDFDKSASEYDRPHEDESKILPRVLSAHTMADATIVETFDKVFSIDREGATLLHADHSIKIRTFPVSRHYKKIAVVVTDSAIVLISRILS